ncbi:MAG TPA: DUF445 domain-containing protein [Gemmatimonadales bacterium]|nr:DUF445 domain-containing protein [Gemmatimonadales bacterium]
MQDISNAEERQRNLDRMKRRATGLLVLMGAVFVAASVLEPQHAWVGYIRATAEASLVGGVADWFAITALFRHPLNLPIPHTAIIPSRKDRIGRSLGNFVQNNFLSPEVLTAKLRAASISRRAAEWLAEPENARKAAQHVATVLTSAGRVIHDEDVHALLDRSVMEPLRRMPIAPVLSKGLELLTVDNRHQQLLDRVIHGLTRLVAENEILIRDRIREESPWWVPEMVDDRIHRKVLGGIERTLFEVGADTDHPLRHQFDELLSEWMVQLQQSPEVIARAEAIKQQILDPETSGRLAASLWGEVKEALGRKNTPGEGGAIDAVSRGLSALANAALEDEALLEKVDGWVIGAVLSVVEQHRHEAGQLIAQTVSAWDPEETSRRIELLVGRDLQYVRINGTLVGGLVGLIIYSVAQLM